MEPLWTDFRILIDAFFIQRNVFENADCGMVVILSRGRWVRNLLMEDKDMFIQHSYCHGCWWLGDTKSQGISSHGIDIVPYIILIWTHIAGNPVYRVATVREKSGKFQSFSESGKSQFCWQSWSWNFVICRKSQGILSVVPIDAYFLSFGKWFLNWDKIWNHVLLQIPLAKWFFSKLYLFQCFA